MSWWEVRTFQQSRHILDNFDTHNFHLRFPVDTSSVGGLELSSSNTRGEVWLYHTSNYICKANTLLEATESEDLRGKDGPKRRRKDRGKKKERYQHVTTDSSCKSWQTAGCCISFRFCRELIPTFAGYDAVPHHFSGSSRLAAAWSLLPLVSVGLINWENIPCLCRLSSSTSSISISPAGDGVSPYWFSLRYHFNMKLCQNNLLEAHSVCSVLFHHQHSTFKLSNVSV